MTVAATTAGVIMAGGRSSRMAEPDKPLRTIGGKPMLRHVIERLSPQVSCSVLNANGDPRRFDEFGLPVVADTIGNLAGPLAGILAGMEWAARRPGTTHLISVAGDTPFFPADLASRLRTATRDDATRIAVAATGGRPHPVFGLWPLSLREALRAFLQGGQSKVMAFVEDNDFVTVEFPMFQAGGLAIDPFFNVNTEHDLSEAERAFDEMKR
jgi:molybdopterin-guanine dinucleotide biosynthesis protein A